MSKRLLLADDSVTIQKVIGITFANEDYQLDIVDNGDSALDHARAQRPDMILADVYMPGKNGYELCAAVKQDPQLASVPVMLLTGTFEPFDEDKARQAGADSWISKPFESQHLIDQVEELLAKVASAPAVATVDAAPATESWDDLADEDDALLELADEEPLEETAEEDIWGGVSLDEDDLLLDEDLSHTDAPEPPAPATSVQPAASAEAGATGDASWDDVNDEIFDLEDDDIIDEADLLDDFADDFEPDSEPAAAAAPVPEQPASFRVEDELLSDEPLEVEAPATGGWPAPEADLPELDAEPVTEFASEAATFSEPAAAPAVEQPVFAAKPAADPVIAPDVKLDETQVAQIVERIASEVVERLAGSLLERIAWEVVPDLAESLIKEEIRKIKENL